MSGCHPTEIKCNCTCHKGLYRFEYKTNPPIPCCACHVENKEQDASPMVKKIQELERQIENLTKDYVHLATFGPTVLVESIKVLEERIKELDSRLESQIIQLRENHRDLSHDVDHLDERVHDVENIEAEPRLINLETHKNYQIDENRKISRRVDELENKMRDVISSIRIKYPHTCPVCKGTTFCSEGMFCVPLHGTVIVWG